MAILNSNDFKILSCIVDKERDLGMCEARGITKKILAKKSELSDSTINRSIKKLLDERLIANAIKQINTNAYYLTIKGEDRLNEILNKPKRERE
jgi:RIO-like serine/threonine protein kinase